MKREDIIKTWLEMLNVKSIEDFNVEQLACLYDELYLSYNGSASKIFDESNDDERTAFGKVLLNCIKDNKQIKIYKVSNEGVKEDTDDDYFSFAERHSVWYDT